ncbi:MBL fold metallo-hydrolase [Ornithinimicrobium panacihumi]|uniref:MBL fold metallo-hydrolase n=1 Tax=Ornithinimicrobium panacihumi TaxID=2008449 RepID=UPI003F886362
MTLEQELAGHVEPGGPGWILGLGAARVLKISVSDMHNNVYVLLCTATQERLLVDAADDAAHLLAVLDQDLPVKGDGRLAQILTTHQHWDHHRALAEVVGRTGARTLAGEADADALPVIPDVRLRHGDTVTVGELVLQVIGLRGHTPGSVALALQVPDRPTVLLTGDSLFPGGPGKTSTPDDFTSLMDDLETRVFDVYGDDAIVLPGHGANTVLGVERPHLAEWRARGW